jgi:hypothetical protein
MVMPVHWAAVAAGAGQRLVHDSSDCAGAAAALGAATEAPVDLAGGTWGAGRDHGATHIMVGEHIARADDHGRQYGDCCTGNDTTDCLADALTRIKKKKRFFEIF